MMWFCPFCKDQLDDDIRNCPSCGYAQQPCFVGHLKTKIAKTH